MPASDLDADLCESIHSSIQNQTFAPLVAHMLSIWIYLSFILKITYIPFFFFFFFKRRYKWEAVDQDSNVKYTMKLCSSSPDTACGENAAVCSQNLTSSKSQSVGKWEFFSRELRKRWSERSLGGRIEQNQTTLQSGVVCLFVCFI